MLDTIYPFAGEIDAIRKSGVDQLQERMRLDTATTKGIDAINSGQALGESLSASMPDGNFTYEFNTTNEQIEFWQNLQLQDPGNGDTQGTLGYFAVSARDFWSQIGDLFDVDAPPPVIKEQFDLWAWYASEQAGKEFDEMQPIDLWYADKKNA